MRGCAGTLLLAVLVAACAPAGGTSSDTHTYLQANLSGGWADGAEASGVDDVTVALVRAVRHAGADTVFLNEACESHAAHAADRLGAAWQWFFVQAWDGQSGCFPAPGAHAGRYGNAVLVRDTSATTLVVPSCNDAGAPPRRCLPNWAPPAEQRRAVCAVTARELTCAAHLDPRHWAPHADQLAALGRIARDLAGEHARVVVGGDLNDGGAAVRAAFGSGFVHLGGVRRLPTYPASRPSRDLDHVLATGRGVRAGGARVVDLGTCAATHHEDGRCTDHLAVVARLAAG